MKIQIKPIATALVISGICLCSAKPSMAQKAVSQKTEARVGDVTVHSNKTVSQQTKAYVRQSPHERNTNLIGNFLKMDNDKAAFNSLAQIKNGLAEELAATKRQVLTANQSGDEKAAEKAIKFNKELSEIYNTVIQKSRSIDNFDKNAVDMAFSKYLKLQP